MLSGDFVVWLGVFVALTLLTIVPVQLHLRRMAGTAPATGQRSEGPAKARPTRPCPSCSQPSAADSTFCENCGVPMLLWELKLSREVQAAPGEQGSSVSHPVPIIAQDVCIGCSACVSACVENVLEIVAGKSSVTNLAACNGAAFCTEACPTGACQLTSGGGAARRVEVPQIAADFETNVKGIYAIGELGGLGLIKNAVNEGQLVIEALRTKHVPMEGVWDFVIVGAGPSGLSASLAAKEKGFRAIVLEQGAFADTIRRFPNKKLVMAEPVRVPMYGSLWISDAPKETLLGVWQTIVDSAGIEIREQEQVLSVVKHDKGLFAVDTPKGRYEAQRVILAIGKRGTPRRLEVAGSDHPKVMYSLTDAAQYTSSRILVVGGGDSAAEAALGLSAQEGNEVTISYRKKSFDRLKEKNRQALESAIAAGRVKFLPASKVAEIRPAQAVMMTETGTTVTLENDYVFALIGGTSPNAFLQKLGVRIVTKEVAMEAQKVPA